MDTRIIKVILTVFILASIFYMIKQDAEEGTTETTLAVSTTIQETTTTTYPSGDNVLPECLVMKTACKKDRCYFGNAINRNNEKLCNQIEDFMLKADCIEKLNLNETLEEAVVQGQVFNTINCGLYSEILVEIRDKTTGVTLEDTQTDHLGQYEFKVTSGNDYGVYVSLDNMILNQNLTKLRSGRHILDFAIS